MTEREEDKACTNVFGATINIGRNIGGNVTEAGWRLPHSFGDLLGFQREVSLNKEPGAGTSGFFLVLLLW